MMSSGPQCVYSGGVTLGGPVLIMKLYKSRDGSISTTRVAVFLFAIIAAVFSRESPTTLLAATVACLVPLF